jgi:hypothetical protein
VNAPPHDDTVRWIVDDDIHMRRKTVDQVSATQK